MIGFRCQRRLTQGPAVKLADRRHETDVRPWVMIRV
jgi:hypothetical protein